MTLANHPSNNSNHKRKKALFTGKMMKLEIGPKLEKDSPKLPLIKLFIGVGLEGLR